MKRVPKNIKCLLSLLTFLVCGSQLFAQPFEIRITEEGNTATVQMRSLADTAPGVNDLVTDLVFGVKWKDERITGVSIKAGNYQVKPSGGTLTHNGFFYQGFGAMETPYKFPETWLKDRWVNLLVLSIHSSGSLHASDEPRLLIAEPRFRLDTGPNIGLNIIDYSPAIITVTPEE